MIFAPRRKRSRISTATTAKRAFPICAASSAITGYMPERICWRRSKKRRRLAR